jgi:hypothetical protein
VQETIAAQGTVLRSWKGRWPGLMNDVAETGRPRNRCGSSFKPLTQCRRLNMNRLMDVYLYTKPFDVVCDTPASGETIS